MQIEAYTRDLEGPVKDFNARLNAGGSEYGFYQSWTPGWLPKVDGREIYEEYFLAVDGTAVRGGYVLKHQPFAFDGQTLAVSNLYQVVSEGSVNPVYNMVSVQILTHAQKKGPLLYALGMGGQASTIAKMLKALGWSMYPVPFYFRVVKPARFLRHIRPLRRSAPLGILMDVLAASGAGAIVLPLHAVLTRPVPDRKTLSGEVVEAFGAWADDVWEEAKAGYSIIAVRDSASMNILYPPANRRAIRLKVSQRGEVAGWVVMLNTQMSDHKHFGAMRVGSVIDCLARPGRETAVAQAASAFLAKSGVDLIVTNQSHSAWCAAFRRSGFLQGPSNFIFGASRKLAERLAPFDLQKARMHFNRGDGEGPSHL